MLNPTPAGRMLDPQGRPYFLWDCEWTDSHFRELLSSSDSDLRAVLLAKLMRQAKPDDVFSYATEAQIRADWPKILPHLGQSRPFWVWLLGMWEKIEAPQAVQVDGSEIFVDTPYEILINKLCALLSRAEFRDLVDLEALIAEGLDWKGALRRAEEKDGGFSSATLGWVLNGMPIAAVGRAAGVEEAAIRKATTFRNTLVRELAAIHRPKN